MKTVNLFTMLVAVAGLTVSCSTAPEVETDTHTPNSVYSAEAFTAQEDPEFVYEDGLAGTSSIVQIDNPRIDGRLIDRCSVLAGKGDCSDDGMRRAGRATCRAVTNGRFVQFTTRRVQDNVVWWSYASLRARPVIQPHPQSGGRNRNDIIGILKCEK